MNNGILVKDNLVNLIAKIGEKITIRRANFFDNSNGVNFSYVHSAIEKGIGKIIAVVKIEGISIGFSMIFAVLLGVIISLILQLPRLLSRNSKVFDKKDENSKT